jgi:hypothetical protein
MSISLWSSQTTPSDGSSWVSIAYGNGLYVAVAAVAGTNRIMTSQDGINWSLPSCPADNNWYGVTYGNGLFVAVASNGTSRVMTSHDGILWTLQTSPLDGSNVSIAYGEGLFICVYSTLSTKVITSPNGTTWTSRTLPVNNFIFNCVTYGNGLFVALGSSPRVMTSPDGITWTFTNIDNIGIWSSVTYGNGLFVAVASNGTSRVMTSANGIDWTQRTAAADNIWRSVTYGNGLFVAVASNGTSRVMTSANGIDWTLGVQAVSNVWWSITYGNGLFVACSINGSLNRIMTATTLTPTIGPFSIPEQQYNTIPYTVNIINPGSTSDGSWSYISSNTEVATVSDNILTIKNIGSSIITAIQAATTSYASGTTTTNLVVSQTSPPIITNFVFPNKIYGETPFEIPPPSSNSSGSFTYISSNLLVATIDGNIITINGIGTSDITATQEAYENYTSGSIETSLIVNNSTFDNPAIITDGISLNYFMNTTSIYANLNNSIEINDELIALNYKKLDTNSDNIIITKLI